MKLFGAIARRLAHLTAVLLLVALGSACLVRLAPGYLSDAREMDARFADSARAQMAAEAKQSSSVPRMLAHELSAWTHGGLGTSRQYGVPVTELLTPRLAVTGSLLLRGILLAWLSAGLAAIAATAPRQPMHLLGVPSTLLLALPAAALATFCLIVNFGGPVLVMMLLLAARDYKFLERLLRDAWRSLHVEYARSLGVPRTQLLLRHVLPSLRSQFLALVTLSLLTALSLVIPIEVIFSLPGVGQLAWNAALNRDYPVLLSVAMLLACAVTLSGLVSAPSELEREARA